MASSPGGVTALVTVCRAPDCDTGLDVVGALAPLVRTTPGAVLVSTACPHGGPSTPADRRPVGCRDARLTCVRVQLGAARGALPCEIATDDLDRVRRSVATWLRAGRRWPGRRRRPGAA